MVVHGCEEELDREQTLELRKGEVLISSSNVAFDDV